MATNYSYFTEYLCGTRRYYNAEGLLHRIDGPAVEYGKAQSGLANEKKNEWWENGEQFFPSFFLQTNLIATKRWYDNEGKCHRDGDLPAVETYDKQGNLQTQKWMFNGLNHRAGDLPSYRSYTPKGVIVTESWWKNGIRQRNPVKGKELPAFIDYCNGIATYHEYFKDGKSTKKVWNVDLLEKVENLNGYKSLNKSEKIIWDTLVEKVFS